MGLDSAFAPEVYTPEYVAEAMKLKPGDRVLLPQSAMTRMNLAKCLRATGAEVTAINAYRTVIGKGGDPVPGAALGRQDRLRHLYLPHRSALLCETSGL